MSVKNYNDLIINRMNEKRYIHSVNVSKEAVRLAILYGEDVKKAEIAGILHDVTKETPKEEQFEIIKNAQINLNMVEKASKKLWHAISGSVFINKELNIEDKDIINAVRYHTTGRENMSLLEKIIFVADFTSDERDYNGVDIMREKSNRSLEEAMLFGLSFSITDLVARNLAIDRNTLSAYNQMIICKIKDKEV